MRCLSKQVLSVNPSYLDVCIDLIDEVFYCDTRLFLEICREKGFSQAAHKLEKSQSAVSAQIALLEKDLGIKLFDRLKRPLLLTESGQLFLEFARDVLNKTEDFERYISELSSGVAGAVKIGASTSVGTYILPAVISQLLKKFPKIHVSVSTNQDLWFSSLCGARM